ncbi:MAG: hypothetical protein AAFZ18_40235 [Myxococcota bacterium]
MKEARRLAQELRDRGRSSPHLERLRAQLDLEGQVEEVEGEIRQEMAAALGRAGLKVDTALCALEVAEIALAEATPEALEAARATYLAARKHAFDARLDLRIHREAIGFRFNQTLDRDYPIPPLPSRALANHDRPPRGPTPLRDGCSEESG